MPIYTWRCTKCECEVDLLRSFDDYRKPPTGEEVPGTDECPEHAWDKRIYPAHTVGSPNWGPDGGLGKGKWGR